MSAGGNVILYVLIAMLVIVALFATVLSILSVRQKLINSRIRERGKQSQDVEVRCIDFPGVDQIADQSGHRFAGTKL